MKGVFGMRKCGMTARIAAAVLAAAMAVSDAVPSFAAGNLTAETTEQGAVNGVSKVIGLEGKYAADWMHSDNWEVEKEYVWLNGTDDQIVVGGAAENFVDSATGLYKNGTDYYAEIEGSTGTVLTLKGKVAAGSFTALPQNENYGDSLPKRDAATGFYEKNGVKYTDYTEVKAKKRNANGVMEEDPDKPIPFGYCFLEQNQVDVLGTVQGGALVEDEWGETNDVDQELLENNAKTAYGKKAAASDSDVAYYEANGKAYKAFSDENYGDKYVNVKPIYSPDGKSYTGVVYALKMAEISFDKKYQYITWKPVSNQTETDTDGKRIKVGYQVRINDQMQKMEDADSVAIGQDKTLQPIITEVTGENGEAAAVTSYTDGKAYASSDKLTYEVRAVYYTETVVKEEKTNADGSTAVLESTSRQILKNGAWSDPLTYSWSQANVKIAPVTGLKTTQKNARKVKVSWNPVLEAEGYEVEEVRSVAPITDFTKADWKGTNVDDWDVNKTYLEFDNSSLGFSNEPELDTQGNPRLDEEGDTVCKPYQYIYFRVRAYVNDPETSWVRIYGEYSAPFAVARNAQANVADIKDLKIENNQDGTFRLVWKPVDDSVKVKVLYTEDEKIFKMQDYLYPYLNAYGYRELANGKKKRVDLVDAYTFQEHKKILEKKLFAEDVSAGESFIESRQFANLEPGKKYCFRVMTYDSLNNSLDRSGTTPYVVNVSEISNKPENVRFGHYDDIKVSSVISAKCSINIGVPSVKSGKTSVTMIFNNSNDRITGYEIYRKSGKKYKKVKTVSSAQYTDEGLKSNTVYDYKVRAYYYNPENKAKAYSDYVFFSAETGNNNYINLTVTKNSKTSAKLKWTKVSGAVQYDIYRTYITSADPVNQSKKYGFGNYLDWQYNQKYELVKTIKKAKTVTWTDKKLKQGTSYEYVVVATYNSGKSSRQIYAADSVLMKAETPKNLKTALNGSTVKVTWDKDKFASKYEVGYKIFDASGNAYKDGWTTKSTKKNSYTIKNVGEGDEVQIRVRAYGDKKWSGYARVSESGKQLKAAAKVKAVEITEKNARGEERTSVKISWNAVSGAKYYKVWRSSSPAAFYNMDKKVYEKPGNAEYIAKESNNDEIRSYSVVPYKDYKSQPNTIVGKSAIDRGNLRTGVTYYYYVQAFSENGRAMSAGYSKPASICYKVTPAIKKLTAKKGKITVTINKVNGASKYEIYRSAKKNKGF